MAVVEFRLLDVIMSVLDIPISAFLERVMVRLTLHFQIFIL